VGKIQQTLPTRNRTIVCNLNIVERIDTQLKKFWEIEEPPHDIIYTREDVKCEKHFEQNVRRNQDGRYVLKMPMKSKWKSVGKFQVNSIEEIFYVGG
jgi:hypothetical protein